MSELEDQFEAATTIQPWDRRPTETDASWNAFQVYLSLPHYHADEKEKRNIANVAWKIGNKHTSQCYNWASEYKWIERARAYDAYQTRALAVIREASLAEFAKHRTKVLTEQLTVLDRIIGKTLQNAEAAANKGDSIDTLSLLRLANAVETVDNLGRRVAGLPTKFEKGVANDHDLEGDDYIIIGEPE